MGIPERSGISDRFLDNYVNADVLAGRSAANNVITESHYCTHAGESAASTRFVLSPHSALSCFPSFSRRDASLARELSMDQSKSALISGSFNLRVTFAVRDPTSPHIIGNRVR